MTDQPSRRPRKTGKPYRRPKKDPVRILAFEALRAVDERDAYANLVLPALLRKAREDHPDTFEARDAALATELVYGTLRRQGTYDAIIAACVDRPLREVDPPVLDVLSLGAHQLLGTRIPSHAAVSATVELARVVLGDGRAKFVNAVLRRITADDLDGWLERVAPPYDEDPEDHLAVVHSHPRWVVSALWDSLGGPRAGIEDLLEADNERPEVTLVARPGRTTSDTLLDGLGPDRALPGRWSPYAVRLTEGGEPGAIDAVREGDAGVQDEGSQLVALALADAPLEGSDSRWLDACAGPGGKAALLAGLAAQRGATLLASEKQPHRAGLVAKALDGNPGPYQVIAADGTRPPWRPGSFDRVLVDVPCTGLGALRRRPEARWRRRPEDLDGFAPLQRALLRTALESVRVGGVVAYATCSPHLAETRAVVDDVLKREGGAELLDARPLMPGVPALGEGPDVQLWPHLHGTDAMYLALLRRTA
ncbi:RsmB/NOP family class I SAM-dependent RNA methyltransferase [Streptomyces albidoflavus]|uniref:RsmB/NOP family class I SAM-dependent RNA methyltransferase n=1 Tax=Streptomyces TaxID=1883 RepID=UPI00024943D9|nr:MULTISPECIES: transcription antitermination factor NusB [Streptomyces]MBL0776187.1 rRNA cytosine-C5-methyltransferase [Streptomyces albidoflavus]MCG5117725.1 rRNA cytosine-C5-methyltransferase [Streptomyces sp. T7(2022)]MCQ9708036.1 rRNA cytosine-C5-methyltransferase [Streptomyces sp. BSP1]MDH6192503.1 16S rRNA (cytosine967-C5)-methyltransferase [Streptomyces sp. CZ24]QDD61662.1 rRNA cytosine-C5-methyltransferase [Streptomyces albidoflavus]